MLWYSDDVTETVTSRGKRYGALTASGEAG
ncbi:hypothetical protein EDC54_10438 [Samsonia erythrinae]|uniref:Uncharacterized protein n=1 Tax=Samsonia erythrinae TaxID=160434 RepID=A0A4R3VML6_9GAMM|nr:hypothetical protein EDC54_10438 [Samsonia erythrinae]